MFEMLNHFTEVVAHSIDSPWLWLIVFFMAGLDALVPFMPSEATVIAVAVLLDGHPLKLLILAVVAAAGAMLGDTVGYVIGRGPGAAILHRLQRRDGGKEFYDWVQRMVRRYATAMIIACRYLPGGRVATALATGGMRFPLARFLYLDAIGCSIWAVQAGLVGWIGGSAFENQPFYGLLLAFAIVLCILGVIEIVRRWLAKSKKLDVHEDAPGELGSSGTASRMS